MNVVFEFRETYLDEFSGGVHAVVGLEAFVVESAIGDFHEELDNAPPVAGFFGYDFGESLLRTQVVVVFCHARVVNLREYMFCQGVYRGWEEFVKGIIYYVIRERLAESDYSSAD